MHLPFKIKSVEPIRLPTKAERLSNIEKAGLNIFFLNSQDVYVDLLTDSGTGAMSENQWAALMRGDESYAGSTSFQALQKAVRRVTGFPLVIPAHQGRGTEQILNRALVKPGMIVPGNAHFDTTRAHIEQAGGAPIDCTIAEAYRFRSRHPFKGNIDLKKLSAFLKRERGRVAYVLITVTCNQVGGQPVSLSNIRAVSALAKRHRIKLFFDGARFAENAYFIKSRERGFSGRSIKEIALEMMRHADGMLMSAKKDAIVNIGGFIALKDKNLFRALAPEAILSEGFLHYGGMSGRDMEALAVGLEEGLDENYLSYRTGQVGWLGAELAKIGMPVLRPVGGHAVYVDAGKFLPHIPYNKYPGHALALALYVEGGVRAVEIGSLMEGRTPASGQNKKARMELLRLAIPRRVYTEEHLRHVIETFRRIIKLKKSLRGVAFTYEAPVLRHFSSRFRWTK